MNNEPANSTGVGYHLSKAATWILLAVLATLIGAVVLAYFGDDVEAMLPWHTVEGELANCGAPVTDVGVFTVQVESITRGSASAVAETFPDRDFCALPAELRPGAANDFTAVMLTRTHPTHATAFLAACKFADDVRPYVDDLRHAGTGVRSRPSAEESTVVYISADGQECRGALPRSITEPGEFVRTYFDVVGNQGGANELSAWLSDAFLERTTPEAAASYWRDQVEEVRVASYSTSPEPVPDTGRALVAIRLCVDETSEPNKPVAIRVELMHDSTSWQIDRVTEQAPEPNHCDD